MKPTITWVLIADGARGRIVRDLEVAGDAADRLHDLTFDADQKQLREIMADPTGSAQLRLRRVAPFRHGISFKSCSRAGKLRPLPTC
ncbi:hypothetical protein ACVOMV_25230 [Mesorhizobium atlanticum]